MSDQTTSLHIKILSDEVDVAKRRLDQLEQTGTKTEKRVKSLGAGFAASMISGLALGVAVGTITRNWLEYDKSMKEVSSIMSTTKEEFQTLREDVLKLATAMGVDATVAAKGLYQAVSAGIPKENAFQFLATASQTAIAGVTSVEKSVDVLTNVINAYKVPVSQAEAISDKLFSAIVVGKITMEELAQSMSTVTVPAAALGVSLDEALSSMVAITLQGTPVAKAATQVASGMTAMKDASPELVKALDDMGYSSARAAIKALGYGEVLQKLRLYAGENDTLFQKLFGRIEASDGVISQSGANFDLYTKAMDASADSAGMTAKAAEVNGATFQVAATKMKNSWMGLMESFEGSYGFLTKLSDVMGAISLKMSGGSVLTAEVVKKGGTQAGIYLSDEISRLKVERDRLVASIRNSPNMARVDMVLDSNPFIKSLGEGDISKLKATNEELESLQKTYDSLGETVKKDTEHFNKLQSIMNMEGSKEGKASAIGYWQALWKAEEDAAAKKLSATVLQQDADKIADDEKRARMKVQTELAEKAAKEREDLLKLSSDLGKDEIAQYDKQIEKLKDLTNLQPEEVANIKRAIAALEEKKGVLLDAQAQQENLTNGMVLPPRMPISEAGKLAMRKEELALEKQIREEIAALTTSKQKLLEVEKEDYVRFAKAHPEEAQSARDAIAAIDLKIAKLNEEEALKAENAGKEVQREAARKASALDQLQQAFLPKMDESNRFALEEAEVVRSFNQRKQDIIDITNITQEERTKLILESENKLKDDLDRINADKNESTRNAIQTGLSDVASIQGQFGEKAFRLAQGAAIAEATMAMHKAAVAAYGSGAGVIGLGPVLAGAALIAGAANIASIASQKYSGAYAMGGMIPAGKYGLVGEAGPEFVQGPAIVTSARSTANQRAGSGDSNPVNVTINNVPGHTVEAKQSDDGKNLEFTIKAVVDRLTSEAQNGGGKFVPALARAHGLTRKA